ncbi:MAG: response regulator [Candidatus Omnitrophica bacterium]|nr:response regulator [Candidatus Omnitrophota bacterium]MBU1996496.1 response regulator [Candidatus Omnitrophota bacterium]
MLSDKIVVVDDDIRVIKSLKMILHRYEIIDFQDGNKAIAFLKKPRDVQLVLLDVMMPEIDGLTVLKEIKKNNKNLTVFIMTAYGTRDVVVQALRGHADDFIEKPFNIEDLEEKIDNVLKRNLNLNKNATNKDYKVARIKNFIRRNYKEMNLDIIAGEMNLNPKYISRMFKEMTGTSYQDFHIDTKMDAAKSLLENTSFNVDEISYQLGYQNPESFMRIFKRKNNITPTEYREKHS